MTDKVVASGFSLAIDKRERDIIDLLKTNTTNWLDSKGRKIEWRAEHLTVGDYIVFYNKQAVLVIERKTWTDLAASMRDGRKENIRKLTQYRDQTGTKIAYLIEGQAFPSKNAKFARIPYYNLRAHLDHLLIRDRIIELRSANHQGTIDRMFEFIKSMSSLLPVDYLPIVGGVPAIAEVATEGDHLELAQVAFKATDDEIATRLWCCIPGISHTSVRLFSGHHISELLLGQLTTEQVSKFSYGNGRVLGNKKAKKILAVAKLKNQSNKPHYLRILSSLPGISRPTAEKILEAFSMTQIMTNWTTIRPQLVELSRGKQRLGESAVATIEKFLFTPANQE